MRNLFYVLLFFTLPVMGQVNISTYGVVGNGIADDTAALQAAFDSGNDLTANPGLTILVSGLLTIDAAGEQIIDLNGATITAEAEVHITSDDYLITINKPARAITRLRNFTVEGNSGQDDISRAFKVRSPVDVDFVDTRYLYDTQSVFAWQIFIDDNNYGQYTFNNCDVRDSWSLSNNVLGDAPGQARAFDIRLQSTYNGDGFNVIIEDFIWDGFYGDDGGPIRIDNYYTGDISGTTDGVTLIGGTVTNFMRRGMKIAMDNVRVYDTSFEFATSANPLWGQFKEAAGVVGIRPLAADVTLDNILFNGCTFTANSTYPWVIISDMDNLVIANCTFANNAGIRIHNSSGDFMGDWKICNTTFGATSEIKDQLDSAGGTGQLPGTTLTYDTNNSQPAASIITFNNPLVTNDYTYTSVAVGDCPALLSGDTAPPTVSGVTISNVTETSFRVSWSLDEGATGQIEYGTTAAYGSTTINEPSYLTFHSQLISGLTAGTLYYFNITGEDAAGNQIVGVQRTQTTAGTPTPDPVILKGFYFGGLLAGGYYLGDIRIE